MRLHHTELFVKGGAAEFALLKEANNFLKNERFVELKQLAVELVCLRVCACALCSVCVCV